METPNIKSAVISGFTGTIAMTAMMMVAPMMGMPKMDIAGMLAGFMHVPIIVGWLAHFMIGTMLAGGFALGMTKCLPLPNPVRGAIYGIIPWLMAQLLVMPMMGMPIFSGSMIMAMGSLMGHLVYGAVLGAMYRPLQSSAACGVAGH